MTDPNLIKQGLPKMCQACWTRPAAQQKNGRWRCDFCIKRMNQSGFTNKAKVKA